MSEGREYPILVVAAVIFSDDNQRVLLERRAPNGVAGLDDMWDLPGGKVECGEEPDAALQREIREEMGVLIDPKHLAPMLRRSVWTYPGVGEKHWLLAAYFCRITSGEPPCNDRLKWFDLQDLPKADILKPDWEFIRWANWQLTGLPL